MNPVASPKNTIGLLSVAWSPRASNVDAGERIGYLVAMIEFYEKRLSNSALDLSGRAEVGRAEAEEPSAAPRQVSASVMRTA